MARFTARLRLPHEQPLTVAQHTATAYGTACVAHVPALSFLAVQFSSTTHCPSCQSCSKEARIGTPHKSTHVYRISPKQTRLTGVLMPVKIQLMPLLQGSEWPITRDPAPQTHRLCPVAVRPTRLALSVLSPHKLKLLWLNPATACCAAITHCAAAQGMPAADGRFLGAGAWAWSKPRTSLPRIT